ncbi:MAG: TonB-dependent receptor [Bernardetiaceae bacterium]|nr:TonB-dependent receptor [Bernardetiaceae bacterium]
MKPKYLFLYLTWLAFWALGLAPAQAHEGRVGRLQGSVTAADGQVAGATIEVDGQAKGTISDPQGRFSLADIPVGRHKIKVRAVGYRPVELEVDIAAGQVTSLEIKLEEDVLNLEGIVVTATRNQVNRQDAPVIVNVTDARVFNATQAVSLSEGLAFQPGLRLENNCSNCGFTQLRMNGLGGPYTQILLNSRPIFSALNGVYGLEQIPVSMVDRIEVVRGGGSALYGANAIAGTVNIITKDPVENGWSLSSNSGVLGGTQPRTGGPATDHSLNANAALVSRDQRLGASFFGMARQHDPVDLNGDGFSEITLRRNRAAGAKMFWKPGQRSRLSLETHYLYEFRRGGNLFDRPAHRTDVAEQLTHHVLGGQLGYETYSADQRNRFMAYLAAQRTRRDSYYGGGGNSPDPEAQAQALLFYGNTRDLALVGGGQFTRSFNRVLHGSTLTVGSEWQHNHVRDAMPGYNRLIDQRVNNSGSYAQWELKPLAKLTLLLGGRLDLAQVNGLYDFGSGEAANNNRTFAAFNPRASVLYNLAPHWSTRASYARGFRPPQAFDEDLHIATLGGTAQFIRLSPDLRQETSHSFTASVDYQRNVPGRSQLSFTAEGFFTRLVNPFVLDFSGEELPGSGAFVTDKRNGNGATVAGTNLEFMYAPSRRLQIQAGATVQQATYLQPEAVLQAEDGTDIFTDQLLRTPQQYGFWVVSTRPLRSVKNLSVDLSGTYTGRMTVANQRTLELRRTPHFAELNFKLAYEWAIGPKSRLQLSGGVQNLLNSFQRDLEVGAERDALYMYGPVRPRTVFIGLKLGSL